MFELAFEGKTYVLKSFNHDRRLFFIENVGKYELSRTPEEIQTVSFVKEFLKRCKLTIWQFIKDEDKKDLGTFESFSERLEYGQVLNFLEWCKSTIEKLNDFFKENKSDGGSESFDRDFIISYIVKKTQWTRDYVENLEDHKVFLLLKHFSKIESADRLEKLRMIGLGVALGRGNKKANEAVKKMESEVKLKDQNENYYRAIKNKTALEKKSSLLTPEQLSKIVGV